MKKPDIIPAKFKYVKTRKSYICEGCMKNIPKGLIVLHISGRIGTWFSEYWCSSCDLDRINSVPNSNFKEKILKERIKVNRKGLP